MLASSIVGTTTHEGMAWESVGWKGSIGMDKVSRASGANGETSRDRCARHLLCESPESPNITQGENS